MQIDMAQEIENTKLEFRARWAQEWKASYCEDHGIYLYGTRRPDLSRAPEPPRYLYNDPEFVGIRWETGFAVITAEAFRKMSQSKINILTGGSPHEKRHHVGRW
ncbi:MAG: hypothetical protein KID04_13305 [Clostridium sp.]|nr:hypothetical protein [Clostridium sp.]